MKKKIITLPERRPVLVLVLDTGDDNTDLYRCPVCGNVADLQNYDCLGADLDCVFCNQCNTECRL